jgi:tetratricopeptide (TPR) repeat protein
MKPQVRALAISLFAATVGLGLACGGDRSVAPPADTAAGLTAQGWSLFESRDYHGALARFASALLLDPTYGDAFNGGGWAGLKLDSLSYALSAFDSALALGVTAADPFAGEAVILRDFDPAAPGGVADFSRAVAAADSALARDLRFRFEHDATLDWRDLRLILAQSLYGLARYDDAKAQVDSLGTNTLDPGSPTFVQDLLAEIESWNDILASP